MRRIWVVWGVVGCGADVATPEAPSEAAAHKEGDAWTWSYVSEYESSTFGWAVDSAGDVNGDGFDDVVVGARDYTNPEEDEGAAFVFHGSPAGLSRAPVWQVESNEPPNLTGVDSGRSVASAGDVNGDGFDDVLVGQSCCLLGSDPGLAYLFVGSATGLAEVPLWIGTDGPNSEFGQEVDSAGDVNQDGFDDVLVGDNAFTSEGDPEELFAGAVFLFAGSPSGPGTDPTAVLRLGTDDLVVDGQVVSTKVPSVIRSLDVDGFGASVGSGGDFDGDGFDDLVVGAPEIGSHRTSPIGFEGVAAVYFGNGSGWERSPMILVSHDRRGGRVFAAFGASVASAGDVNGDGFDDVVVGAPGSEADAEFKTQDSGEAFLFFGSSSGVPSLPDQAWTEAKKDDEFGVSVDGAGDLDGDGFDDVVVGAPHAGQGGQQQLGAVFVYDGSATGLSVAPSFVAVGKGSGRNWLGQSVSRAGDVNGDGLSDVVAGAPMASSDPADFRELGAVLVLHGD